VITDADKRFSIRREYNAVDVLRMTFQHALRSGTERPEPYRRIPGCGCERRTIGRHSKAHNRPAMTFKNLIRLLAARRPDRYSPIRSRGGRAAVWQEVYRVHCVGMKAKNLLGGFSGKRPSDRRGVEAAGQDALAVGRSRQRANRSTMAGKLSRGSFDTQRQRCRDCAEVQSPIHCLSIAVEPFR